MIESVSSSAGQPATFANPGGKLGKDEFLKLFIAQVRHQDPMSPLQAQEMAAQLAQFSSVEQLVEMNEQLDAQASTNAAMVQAINGNVAMGLLGRTVLATGNHAFVAADGTGSVTVDVGGAGGAGTLRLYDAAGNEVGSRALGELPPGRQTLDLGTAATGLPAGAYTYAVEVAGETPVQTYTRARIDGLRYSENGPVLGAGPITIPFGGIVEILAQ